MTTDLETLLAARMQAALAGGGPHIDKFLAAHVTAHVAAAAVEEERAMTNRALKFLVRHATHHIDCNLSEWAMSGQETQSPDCSCGLDVFVVLAEARGLA